MESDIAVLKAEAESYKLLYKTNRASRAEAFEKITPYIEAVNEKATTLAKKYNVRPKLVTVAGYLR